MLGNAIAKAIGQLMWSIVEGIFKIISNLGECFMYLSGISPSEENGSILSGLYNDDIKNVYMFMFFIGIIVLVISILVGLIKAQYNKEASATKQVITNSFKAMFFLVLIPIICYVFINFVSVILNFVINGTQYYLGQNSSNGMGSQIAEGVFNASLPASYTAPEGITWTMGYETLISKPYEVPLKMNGYNYILSILVSAMILWALLMTTISLVERIINLILLYFSAPIVIATSPLDSGSRFLGWKDMILAKYLGVVGNILSMTIYLYLASWINNKDHLSGLEPNVAMLVKCIVLVAGAFMCSKGNVLISSLISHNVGQQEGLSQQQTGSMLRGGMALGGAIIHGAGRRANQLASAGAGGVSGALGSGSSGSLLGGGDNNGVQLAPKPSLLKGIGSKVSSGASQVKNGGLLAVAGLVGAAFNPMNYVRAFRKDDSKFLEKIGSKKGNLSAHESKRLDKMANKEATQQQRQANLDSGKNRLEARANEMKSDKKFASINSPMK